MGSLKLVETLAVDGPINIPEKLRELADDIASGRQRARTALVVVDDGEVGGEITSLCFGHRPRKFEVMGLLEFAQRMLFSD